MKRNKIKPLIVFALLLASSVQGAFAEQRTDTLEVKFRVGQSDIDLSYADNERRIAEFTRLVKEYYASVPMSQLKFDIFTGASPEGPTELNKRLGEQRGVALRNLLKERLGEQAPQMAVVNKGARWGELYQMVDKSNEEWREDVLRILSKQPAKDNWRVDPREQQLRKLKNGAVWRELDQRYLPVLRASGMAVIASIPEVQKDTIVIINKDTIYYLPEPIPGEIIDHRPFWAVKTNLLLWGVIAPNLQLEIPLGHKNRWSVEAEVFLPWWTWSHNAHAEQFFDWGLELRYWLGNRERHHTLDGWHIGLAVAMGYYDFEWQRSHGYQGEYVNTYVNFGWQKRISTHWAFDAGVGLGYIPTQYREYLGSSVFPVGYEEEYDDHLMWQRTQWRHILGLTHANLTVAYMFDPRPKSKRTKLEPLTLDDIDRHYMDQKMQRRAEKERAKFEDTDAKARAKADKAEAEAREKAAKAEAKVAAKAAKAEAKASKASDEVNNKVENTDKAAKAAAKQAEKEAKAAAKQAEEDAKAAAKAEKEAAKNAEKVAKAAAKKVEKEAEEVTDKAAAKAAAAEAKAKEKAEKEAAKVAAAEAKAAAEAEKEAAKVAAAEAKAKEKAEKEAAKVAAAEAKAAAEAEKEAAKVAEAEAKAAAKAAEAEAKAAAKNAEAEAKAAAKAAEAEAKAVAEAEKAAAKQAAAEAKAAAKAEKEAAKAAAKAAKSND